MPKLTEYYAGITYSYIKERSQQNVLIITGFTAQSKKAFLSLQGLILFACLVCMVTEHEMCKYTVWHVSVLNRITSTCNMISIWLI